MVDMNDEAAREATQRAAQDGRSRTGQSAAPIHRTHRFAEAEQQLAESDALRSAAAVVAQEQRLYAANNHEYAGLSAERQAQNVARVALLTIPLATDALLLYPGVAHALASHVQVTARAVVAAATVVAVATEVAVVFSASLFGNGREGRSGAVLRAAGGATVLLIPVMVASMTLAHAEAAVIQEDGSVASVSWGRALLDSMHLVVWTLLSLTAHLAIYIEAPRILKAMVGLRVTRALRSSSMHRRAADRRAEEAVARSGAAIGRELAQLEATAREYGIVYDFGGNDARVLKDPRVVAFIERQRGERAT